MTWTATADPTTAAPVSDVPPTASFSPGEVGTAVLVGSRSCRAFPRARVSR